MIRYRIVCGINDDRTQRHLLLESALDFKKALEIAQSMEIAAKSIIDLLASQSQVTSNGTWDLFTSFKSANVTSGRTQTAVNI